MKKNPDNCMDVGRGTWDVERVFFLTCHASRITLPRLIRLYQLCISPMLGVHCRFAPSCSHYAQDAVGQHGVIKGSVLTLKRLARCHPLGGSGYDPVPSKK